MTNTSLTIEDLIKIADEGKHLEIELVTSPSSCKVLILTRNAYIKVTKLFQKLIKQTFRSYLTSLKKSEVNIEFLLTMKAFERCEDFFKEEVRRAQYMLDEYDEYLGHGHFFTNVIFDWGRADEDMFDHLQEYRPEYFKER